MASIFGHAIAGFTISSLQSSKGKLLVLFAIVSAMLPDIDVLSFNLGISYSHPLGHRGFTHSILFAIIWGVLITSIVGRKNKLVWFVTIFLSTISHGVLDAMTSGGKGVGFFIPFNNDRFFLPFREIKVSPLGVERFFSEWGLQVIISELKYIVLPCILILLVRFLFQKQKNA